MERESAENHNGSTDRPCGGIGLVEVVIIQFHRQFDEETCEARNGLNRLKHGV